MSFRVGRPRKYLYSTRLGRGSSSGQKVKKERSKFEMEPVRRSTREKRLVFATLNLSEIDKQILDPKHGYPDVDSSEVCVCVNVSILCFMTILLQEEMEPYEKLFSPKRVIRKSSRLCAKLHDAKPEEGTSKKVKEERASEEGKGTRCTIISLYFPLPLNSSYSLHN